MIVILIDIFLGLAIGAVIKYTSVGNSSPTISNITCHETSVVPDLAYISMNGTSYQFNRLYSQCISSFTDPELQKVCNRKICYIRIIYYSRKKCYCCVI